MLKNKIKSVYYLLRIWSLDVVTGAIGTGVLTTKILDVKMPAWWWFVLSLSVWIIYTADHLFDGLKTEGKPAIIYRHIYHSKYKKSLILILASAIILNLILVFSYAPFSIIIRGIILSVIVGVYFLFVHYFKSLKHFYYQKELAIAVIYVTGIIIGPITFYIEPLAAWQIILIIVMISLAWAEGVMASWFDYEKDLHDNHISFATVFGKIRTRYFLITLHILIFILLKINILLITETIAFIAILTLALMNLILLLILLNPEKMSTNERYRIAGEMVFWLPLLFLLF